MSVERRKFLKMAGLTALGLAGGAPARILGQDNPFAETAAEAVADTTRVHGPLTGSRWAMVVDVRKCQAEGDCKKCSAACHLIHNVPEFNNPKDEIKWIWKESFEHALGDQDHQYLNEEVKEAHMPVLCNHCDNPPCVKVCPTGATFKRKSDGLVMMDWHRCIGCRYCMAACPYGSRSFNWRDPRPFVEHVTKDFPTRTRGVVEKCTFCDERLARGELPACVEACTAGALVFGDLEDPNSEVRRLLAERFSMRRKPGLGTQPEVYYLL